MKSDWPKSLFKPAEGLDFPLYLFLWATGIGSAKMVVKQLTLWGIL